MTPQPARTPLSARDFAIATLLYAAFVVYGSLVPLDFHYHRFADAWASFRHTPYLHLGVGSRADWVANILLYIPLSFLATGWLSGRNRKAGAGTGTLVFLCCTMLAIAVEFTQLYFPPRTVSLNDIIAEIIGSGMGIGLWLFAGLKLTALLDDVRHGGRHGTRALMALYTIAYLALSLFPFDFLVSAGELLQKLGNAQRSALLVTQSCGGPLPCGAKLLSEILVVAPLGIFLGIYSITGRKPTLRSAFGWGVLLGLVIEGLQAFLATGISQGASIITRGLGVALGLATYRAFDREWLLRHRVQLKTAALFALPLYAVVLLAFSGFFTSPLQSHWVALAKLREVHFLPFYYHYFTSESQALYSLLANAGVYAPIGVFAWVFYGARKDRSMLRSAAWAGGLTALALETLKLFLGGARPDPTNVWIAATSALVACLATVRLSRWAGPDSQGNLGRPSESPTAGGLSRFDRTIASRRARWRPRHFAGSTRWLGDRGAAQGALRRREPVAAACGSGCAATGGSAQIPARTSPASTSLRCRHCRIAGRQPTIPARDPQPRQRRQGQPRSFHSAGPGGARKR